MHKVRKERIWIEAINAENRIRNDWQENWSFLADYDQKVNKIYKFNFIAETLCFILPGKC